MSEFVASLSRRSLLSATALLGGGAALYWMQPRATAAETSRISAITGYSGLVAEHHGFGLQPYFRPTTRYPSGEGTDAGVTLVDPATNILYAGGYGEGNEGPAGLASTHLDIRLREMSPAAAGIGWVTGMVISGTTLFFSTNDECSIHTHHMPSGLSAASSYRKLTSLGGRGQSRAEAWTAATEHVAFATVPVGVDEHGDAPPGSTGALGVINKATAVVSIHGNLFPGHRITYLASIGNIVYGITRAASNDTAPLIFAFDPITAKVLWRREAPTRTASYGTEAYYGLVAVNGMLYAAGQQKVLEVDPRNGQTVRPLDFSDGTTAENRPRRQDIALVHVQGTQRLLHASRTSSTIVSLSSGRISSTVGPELAPFAFSDASGALWSTTYLYGYRPVATFNADGAGARFRGPSESPFLDVPTGGVFYDEISWLSQVGVSDGWTVAEGRQFRPGATVTRETMAAFLFRLAGSPTYTSPTISPFADVPTRHVFYTPMAWLAETGVSTGWAGPNGTRLFRPAANVSRDVMAAFMYRLAGQPAYDPPKSSPFADVPVSHVFYKEISWMHAKSISAGWTSSTGVRTYGPNRNVTRDAMAAFLYRLAANAL